MDLTECGVCYQKFDSSNHVPFIGSCGHTYCGFCIIQIEQTCPTCREKSFILPKRNFLAIEMLDLVRAVTPGVKQRLAHCEMYESLLRQAFEKQAEETQKRDKLQVEMDNLRADISKVRFEKTLAMNMVNQKSRQIEERDREIARLIGEIQSRDRALILRDRTIEELNEKLRKEELMKKAQEDVYVSAIQRLTAGSRSVENAITPSRETEQFHQNEFHQKKLKRNPIPSQHSESPTEKKNRIEPTPSVHPKKRTPIPPSVPATQPISCSTVDSAFLPAGPQPVHIPLLMIAPPGYFERDNRENNNPTNF